MNQYTVGTSVEVDASFTDVNGVLLDPSTVTAEIRTPDQVVTDLTSTVFRKGQGQYAFQFTPTQSGLHQYRFKGTGNVVAANEGNFMATTEFTS